MKKLTIIDNVFIGLHAMTLLGVLFWLFFGPRGAEYPSRIYLYIETAVFVFYSGAFTVLLATKPQLKESLYKIIIILDLLFMTILIQLTGKEYSVFYLGYCIEVAFYTLTFGFWPGFGISLLSLVLYVGTNLPALSEEHWVGMLIRSGFIMAVALSVGYSVEGEAREKREVKKLNEFLKKINEKLDKRAIELHAVAEMASIIHSTLDFDELGRLIMDLLKEVLHIKDCSLIIVDKKSGEVIFSAEEGLSSKKCGKEVSFLVGKGASDTESFVSNSGSKEEIVYFKCIPVLGQHVPLLSQEKMTAALCAGAGAIDKLTEEDMFVLSAVATQLIIALENFQLYELTQRLSITDELTELHNYRYLQQRLKIEIGRAERYKRSLSLIMMDVDDFKPYNDAYGHIKGDRALAEIGKILKENSRELDIVARYGGEEFSMILPETDISGAFVVAEKIREAISDHLFVGEENKRNCRLTMSFGVASYPRYASNEEELLKAADDALYLSKSHGRDRVYGPKEKSSERSF
ncbi:MAG: diguanylate cyclase [Actinobacteria bacterium]|nr:diguanylate cyclase [Actinomycetota bacterium]